MSFLAGIDTTKTEYGGLDPIPKGTIVRCCIEEINLKEVENDEQTEKDGHFVLKFKIRVYEPEAYSNRVVYLNLKMWSPVEKTTLRAKNLFVAIDNYFGKKSGQDIGGGVQYLIDAEDEDAALTPEFIETLENFWIHTEQEILLQLGVYDVDGSTGNFLLAVPAEGSEPSVPEVKKPAAKQPPKPPTAKPGKPSAVKHPPKPPAVSKPKPTKPTEVEDGEEVGY